MSQLEGISVVLPVRNVAGSIVATIERWVGVLTTLHREWEIIIVDDGSTDDTMTKVHGAYATNKQFHFLKHEQERGLGSSLRTALGIASLPLFFYTSADYPYTPSDLKKMLERIELASEAPDPTTGTVVPRKPDLVSGCRTGVPVPAWLSTVGWFYRSVCRLVLGLPLEKLPGWYGFGEHLRAWKAWIVYGVPLEDPNSAFKLFRRSMLDRFPIQSDGGFAAIEMVAKCTFLTCIMDELPLTPKNTPIPSISWPLADRRRVFSHPQFAVKRPVTAVG